MSAELVIRGRGERVGRHATTGKQGETGRGHTSTTERRGKG
jgi:hypothetical protein